MQISRQPYPWSNATPIVQDVKTSAGNSSTTNLAAGNSYTFTGTSASTLGVAGIQVSLFADKNCIVKVQQSPDNANWDLSDTYYYTASGNFGVTIQAVSSYTRVIVTTNSLTTTIFRLQTALCPIVEALPRSLDVNGNLKIANSVDEYGFITENTPMGEERSVTPYRLVGAVFEGTTIDPNFWTTAAAGTAATITQADAQILLTSGTSNAAAVTMYSVRRGRYIGGSSMRYRAVIQLGDTGTATNKRRWGIGYGATMPTITDGAWFQLDGTEFSVVTCKGTTETKVTAFNGNLGQYTPPTTVTTFEIYWTNSKIWFVVGDTILHIVSASTATWTTTKNFHVFADSLNSGVLGASVTLAVRTATIARLGLALTQPTSKRFTTAATTVCKYGPGILHRIFIGDGRGTLITIYDNTAGSGTVIAGIFTPATANPYSLEMGIPFQTGLTIVSTGTWDCTVVYE
jgi:hypothetical protein